jgi:branched-chain amino acid transport system ATP-binding protein
MLQLNKVSASYSGSQVLFDVEFAIAEGEVVTLMGRNGMGKTSLVRAIFGMSPITREGGEIRVAGHAVQQWASHRIARLGLGLVPEGRQVFSLLTVQENLLATARPAPSGWTLERVYTLFPRLKERREYNASRLSGGEQQMLAIGRALMTNPSLLVLDEATEGLAPLVRQAIWQAITQLRQERMSILIIDHAIDEAARIADRHYVIEKGRIVAALTARELAADVGLVERYLHL